MPIRPGYGQREDENKTWLAEGFDGGSYSRYASHTKSDSGSQVIEAVFAESVHINKAIAAAKSLFETWQRGMFTVSEGEPLIRCFEGTTAEVCIDQIYHPTGWPKVRLIRDLGWSLAEVIETRNRLASFEEDWDAPGMELYDEL